MEGEKCAEVYWDNAVRSRLEFIGPTLPLVESERIADVYRRIDAEVAAIHMALSFSKSLRNAIAPVSRLPPEILTIISGLHALHDPPRKRYLGWMKITHVCQHWRAIAIDAISLWRNIDMDIGAKWVDTMLNRARGSPVVLSNSLDHPVAKPMVEVVIKHIAQTRELSIHGGSRKPSHQAILELCRRLTVSAPLLRSLSLSRSTGRYSLPQDAFGDCTPQLRRVNLFNIVFPWRLCFTKNLTHLSVVRDYDDEELNLSLPPISVDDVLDFLNESPNLQKLTSVHCFPPFLPGRRQNRPAVNLSHLTSLDLSVIVIPPTAHLNVVVALSEDIRNTAFRAVLAALSTRIGSCAALPYFRVRFSNNEPNLPFEQDLHVELDRSSDHDFSNPQPALHMWIFTERTYALHGDLAGAFMLALPPALGGLTKLETHIGTEDDFSELADFLPYVWLETFGRRTEVREVHADYGIAEDLCEALSKVQDPETERWHHYMSSPALVVQPTFFLPKLSFLALHHVDPSSELEYDGQSSRPLSEMLVQTLEARRLAGFPLDTLHLVAHTRPDSQWVEKLSAIITIGLDIQ
ncbi:hypothetical protein BV25DRAFT_1837462 [Artomyces pyxidatus]|uniref:Uncharacterized protein n=1 Tax=Artomyces pyxidatus TaxID=48021 RepID=A0ACB8T672_9AGAM|nr:hypothetical protein BV25DRAFT_1837462 [Artomyces pyxidatus]